MDLGWLETEKLIALLKADIEAVYREARDDLQNKFDDFNRRFAIKDATHKMDVLSGRWTQQQYNDWVRGQVFQSNLWKQKRDEAINVLTNANIYATNLINDQRLRAFIFNGNYQAYLLEHGANINFGFELYDMSSVMRLIKENPQLLPEWKIDEAKDYIWNQKKLNNAIRQGIIQGEDLNQITDRVAKSLSGQNERLMNLFAQTAMTGAQNAGRMERLGEAEDMGIKVEKEWMATLDAHTRTAHQILDGQRRPINEPFEVEGREIRYPGDPHAHPSLVYNCRCTIVGVIEGLPNDMQRRDNISGELIEYMTYSEWLKAKGGKLK